MNERKLQQLWRTARQETPPPPDPGLESSILRAIGSLSPQPEISLASSLTALFPRLSVAALSLIVICAASDLYLAHVSPVDLTEGVVALSEQWLFTGG